MNRMKKAMVLIGMIGVMVTMAACNVKFDASGYVKSCLDLLTRCEYKEYAEFTKQSKEEAVSDYETSIGSMMSDFESLSLSEELVGKYRTFFEELYKMTKYEVAEATENEDGTYSVEVSVFTLTGVFNGVTEELNAAAVAYGEELAKSGEEADDQAVNEWVYNKLYEIINTNLANVSYEDAQTITVSVVMKDDIYTIEEADYVAVEEALVDLGDMAYE